MKQDPFFKQNVWPDHDDFADTKRPQYVMQSPSMSSCMLIWRDGMTVEWVTDVLVDLNQVPRPNDIRVVMMRMEKTTLGLHVCFQRPDYSHVDLGEQLRGRLSHAQN